MIPRKNGVDPDDAEDAGAENGDDHGQPRFSKSAHHAAADLHDAAQEIRRCNIVCADEAHGDHGIVSRIARGDVDAEQLRAKDGAEDAERNADQKNGRLTGPENFHHPVIAPCAEILAGEGDGGMEHGVHGRVGKGGDVGGGGVRGDHVRAEGVDAALHHDVGDVENDGLKPRRKADLDHAERLVRMQADLPELELRRALLPYKADEDEHDGDILRNDGRNGDACNVQLTDDHKEQIQENVQHTGNGEEDERALRIAVGAEDGGGKIVDQRAGNADEIDAQIEAGQRQNVVRRVHPFEHRRGKEETEQERHHAQNEAQGDGAVDGTLDARVVAAAGIARDQNVDTDGNADERAGQKIDERRGRADGGQGICRRR